MALYHVRISVAGERSDETKLDLTEGQLEQQFLGPYREGRPITVNGRVVQIENLERIRISRSDQPSKDLIRVLQDEDRASPVALVGGPSYAWRAAGRAEDVTDALISGPPRQGAAATPPVDAGPKLRRVTVPSGPGDRRSVFLVHGRNLRVSGGMVTFLRALDLRVIEWERAVSLTGEPNPYIGDVISAGLEEADAVVVLATPDDFVRLDPELASDPEDPELSEARQPRQNVVYEAGMAMALAPTRTLIVAVPGTKILSDIAGRHLAHLDDSAQARKRIVSRLQTMGLAVDDSGEAWLEAGDFGDSVQSLPPASFDPLEEGVDEFIGDDEPPRSPAFLTQWRHSTDGIEASPVMQMASTSMPGGPPSSGQTAFARFGICITCDPLDPDASSSAVGSAFLDLLESDVVESLLAPTTDSQGDNGWTRLAGNGLLRFDAVGGQLLNDLPRVSAMFLTPARGMGAYGRADRLACLWLHMELAATANDPAPRNALSLPDLYSRFSDAIAVACGFDAFLATGLGLRTWDRPPAKLGVLLQTPGALADLIDTDGLSALPGAVLSNQFIGYAIAERDNGKPSNAVAKDLLTQLCDHSLHLDKFEPVIGAL